MDIWCKQRVMRGGAYAFERLGTGAAYALQAADAGALINCEALGSGLSGRTVVPTGPESSTRG